MSTTLAAPASFVARPESSGAVIVRGTTLTFLVESHRTGDAWSLVAYDAPPGFAAGEPHHHERTTEIFYVLDGTLTVLLGDETVEVGPGGCAVVTPGTTHTFSNRGTARVRLLTLATPGGHDAFLRELLAIIAVSPTWPPVDPTPIRALGARYDTVYGRR
jgi:mannose-6-phosphate isomerase-like protein (cupin superfamily)